ncbi:MAG: ferredoxin [archaeon]|nr:ferredoxin [archaeon]
MTPKKVIHLKKDCISCGACAAVSPKFWELDAEGMAQLKGAHEEGDHWRLDIENEKDIEENQEASDVCPVNIIHVKDVDEE